MKTELKALFLINVVGWAVWAYISWAAIGERGYPEMGWFSLSLLAFTAFMAVWNLLAVIVLWFYAKEKGQRRGGIRH